MSASRRAWWALDPFAGCPGRVRSDARTLAQQSVALLEEDVADLYPAKVHGVVRAAMRHVVAAWKPLEYVAVSPQRHTGPLGIRHALQRI